jgi:hypothetical protein
MTGNVINHVIDHVFPSLPTVKHQFYSQQDCELLVGKNPANWFSMRRSESWQHLHLKKLAAQWAYAHGFRCIGLEVRAPRSRFRVDVAAYRRGRKGSGPMTFPDFQTAGQSYGTGGSAGNARECRERQTAATTNCSVPGSESDEPLIAIFECKQSRPDLYRDIAEVESMRHELHELQQRRTKLEKLLLTHHPSLRASESLFPEWDTFAGEFLMHAGYQRLLTSIIRVQNRLQNCTKFAWITHYRLANLNYVVAPEKLMTLDELPPGWGLLESNNRAGLNLYQQAQFMRIQNPAPWLERIGQSTTVRWLRQEGLVGTAGYFQPALNL